MTWGWPSRNFSSFFVFVYFFCLVFLFCLLYMPAWAPEQLASWKWKWLQTQQPQESSVLSTSLEGESLQTLLTIHALFRWISQRSHSAPPSHWTLQKLGTRVMSTICAQHWCKQRQWPSSAGTVKTVEQNPVEQPHPVNMDLNPFNILPLPTGTIFSFVSRGHNRDIAGGRDFSFWSQVLTGQALAMWTASRIDTQLLM